MPKTATNKLAVTGVGCSGTGYIAEVLTKSGVLCGHELVYNPKTLLGFRSAETCWATHQLDADASWLLALNPRRHRGPIVLQLRDPLRVAYSYLNLGFYSWDDRRHRRYRAAVAAYAPYFLSQEAEVDRILSQRPSAAGMGMIEVLSRLSLISRVRPAKLSTSRMCLRRRIRTCRRHSTQRLSRSSRSCSRDFGQRWWISTPHGTPTYPTRS
jgi:hypothetical protein